MMTKMYTKLIENISPLIFISILLVASFAITADDSENVEEIIVKGNVLYADQVTALKTPVPILDVPQTVSIVTDDDIRKQGFRGIGDIIRYVPGVNMKYAHTKTFQECQINFILDREHTPYKIMQRWGEYIFQHQDTPSISGERGRAAPDSFIRTGYYDDYTADLIIDKIETKDKKGREVVSRYRLTNAYPYTVSAVTYANGPNQPVRFMCNFNFEYMREIDPNVDPIEEIIFDNTTI